MQASILRAKESGDKALEIPRMEAAYMISENNKYDHQCYISVSELLKLRLRILIAQREEMEELDRSDLFLFHTPLLKDLPINLLAY